MLLAAFGTLALKRVHALPLASMSIASSGPKPAYPWIFSPRASISTNFAAFARRDSGFLSVCTRQQ